MADIIANNEQMNALLLHQDKARTAIFLPVQYDIGSPSLSSRAKTQKAYRQERKK